MDRIEIRPAAGGLGADLGAPQLPGSKSHAQRALLLAAAGPGTWLRGVPRSRDVEVLCAALAALGTAVERDGDDLRVGGGWRGTPDASLHVGENATALRFLVVAVALLGGRLRLDGDPGLRRRPLGAVWQLLAQGGVAPDARTLPAAFDATAAVWPDVLRVDGQLTTQPASGALLGLALRTRRGGAGGAVEVRAPAAAGYLDVTTAVLAQCGHRVDRRPTADGLRLRVAAAPGPLPAALPIPADPSSATFPRALAALHGRSWRGPDATGHPDDAVVEDLARLAGAAPGERVVLDRIAARPDAFPALCAVAAGRDGETELCGAPALRAKESDRIAAMAAGLRALGVPCAERPDGLRVRGPLPPRAALCALPAPPDHRVVMALALLGTRAAGGVSLPHADAVAKSWPDYFDWLGRVADVRR